MFFILERGKLLWGCATVLFTVLAVGALTFGLHPNLKEWQEKGLVISYVTTAEKAVALTFDDGPDPDITPQVLDVLAKNNARATFFVVGVHAERWPSVVKKIHDLGHEVGNHGFSHDIWEYNNSQFAFNDVKRTEELIKQITGKRPVLLRPPGGFLSRALIKMAQEQSWQVVTWTWSADYKDWNATNSQKLARSIVNNVQPGQIILLHDRGRNRKVMIKALSIALPELTAKGYRCVTVSELMRLKNK